MWLRVPAATGMPYRTALVVYFWAGDAFAHKPTAAATVEYRNIRLASIAPRITHLP
jgi:hypothetical protein